MRTLRSRTTALVVLVTGLTLAAGGWALVLTLQARITATNDRVDQARLRELVAAAQAGDLTSTITDVGDEGVAQVVDPGGRVLARSANIPDADRIGTAAAGPRPTVATVDAPDDDETERYRLWAVSAPTPDGPVTAYVGTSEESVHEASRTLTRALHARRPARHRAPRPGHLADPRPGAAAGGRHPQRGRLDHRGGAAPPGADQLRSTTRSAGWPPR